MCVFFQFFSLCLCLRLCLCQSVPTILKGSSKRGNIVADANVSPFARADSKTMFCFLASQRRNILRETNAANTQYYAREMQNKPWNLVNIVSSTSKRENICCGRKMFLNEFSNKCCVRVQTGKHLRPQQCFLVCYRGL